MGTITEQYINNHAGVEQYYKDSDGYWIELKSGWLRNGAVSTIHEDTILRLVTALKHEVEQYQFFILGSSSSKEPTQIADDIAAGHAELKKLPRVDKSKGAAYNAYDEVDDNNYGSWDEINQDEYELLLVLTNQKQ